VAVEKTKWGELVLTNAMVALAAFGAGFFIANRIYDQYRYINTIGLIHRMQRSGIVPLGKLIPGAYSIPFDHGQSAIFCRIVRGKGAGSLRELDVGYNRPTRPTFMFTYKNHDRFHTPLMLLTAGHPGTMWIDVGLKGRFLFKVGPDGHIMTLLKGDWVPFRGGLRSVFHYKGEHYKYDAASGDWREVGNIPR